MFKICKYGIYLIAILFIALKDVREKAHMQTAWWKSNIHFTSFYITHFSINEISSGSLRLEITMST